MKDPAITALEAIGHVKVANTRCQAQYRKNSAPLPGGLDVPIWCDLTACHEGPHRHWTGNRFLTMDDARIEMVPLPDICQKCGVRWPCKDAETVINAFANPEPCSCYPEHCTDTSHGECWCNPAHEGDLIIHNQGS